MGGAGFPTGLKWEIVRNAPGDAKYIVCNADESEPGTFKDRFLLENVPHLLVEGMLLAGLVTGARLGIVYIRHEYEAQIEIVEHEIAAATAAGLLGAQHPRLRPRLRAGDLREPRRLHLRRGVGAAGGARGQAGRAAQQAAVPRHHGLHGKPTVINNVETFVDGPRRSWPTAPSGSRPRARTARPGSSSSASAATWRARASTRSPMGTPAPRGHLRSRRRRARRPRRSRRWAPSGPAVRLPAALAARHAARLRLAGRGRLDARLGRAGRAATTRRACSTWRSTPCASSATSRAASACPAGSARPRWWRCSPADRARRAARPSTWR